MSSTATLLLTGGGQPGRLSNALRDYRDEIEQALSAAAHVRLAKYKPDPKVDGRISDAAYDDALCQWLIGTGAERFVIAGHSWGGWRGLRVARRMAHYARWIDSFVAIDAVGRKPLGSALKVENVVRFWSWRQRGAISGSDLIIDPRVLVLVNSCVNRSHMKMDELPVVRETILRLATAA